MLNRRRSVRCSVSWLKIWPASFENSLLPQQHWWLLFFRSRYYPSRACGFEHFEGYKECGDRLLCIVSYLVPGIRLPPDKVTLAERYAYCRSTPLHYDYDDTLPLTRTSPIRSPALDFPRHDKKCGRGAGAGCTEASVEHPFSKY